MSFMTAEMEQEALKALEVLNRERAMSLSEREWKHRLIGYGYRITVGADGPLVARHDGTAICALPETLH